MAASLTSPHHAAPSATFAVIDLETSGLDATRHRILQVAVTVTAFDGTVVRSWSSSVKPGLHRVGARDIHGISRRSLRGAPAAREVLAQLAREIEGLVVVAHNAPFDLGFLQQAYRRAHLPWPVARWICTATLSRELDPERTRTHRLSDLCARYGVDPGRAHDAVSDAEATAAVLPHLLGELGVTDLEALASRLQTDVPPPRKRSGLVRRARRRRRRHQRRRLEARAALAAEAQGS
jgi:DNA polymerase III epsilon subunit-like protein